MNQHILTDIYTHTCIGRNLPVVRGLAVKITAWQDLEMLVMLVTLSVPIPQLKDKEVKKMIDFHDYDENQAIREAAELAAFKASKIEPPPIEFTLKYQLTDCEIGIFGTNNTVNNKQFKLGRDSEIEHPATFVWNMLSRLHIIFKVNFDKNYNTMKLIVIFNDDIFKCIDRKPEFPNILSQRRLSPYPTSSSCSI